MYFLGFLPFFMFHNYTLFSLGIMTFSLLECDDVTTNCLEFRDNCRVPNWIDYMRINCRKSCGFCDPGKHKNRVIFAIELNTVL